MQIFRDIETKMTSSQEWLCVQGLYIIDITLEAVLLTKSVFHKYAHTELSLRYFWKSFWSALFIVYFTLVNFVFLNTRALYLTI